MNRRFNILLQTVEEIKQFLHLQHFSISIIGENSFRTDASIDITYKYHRATITFDNKILNEEDDTTFHQVIGLFIHECCHIFGSVGTTYFDTEEENLLNGFSKSEYALHSNAMIITEEQMVTVLEKIFTESFIKTKQYKQLKKQW